MYLTCSLLESESTCGYKVSCRKPGPDNLVEFKDGYRCWIEGVIVTDGEAGHPDSVVDRSGEIPEGKIVLRYTNAIDVKYKTYRDYLRQGTEITMFRYPSIIRLRRRCGILSSSETGCSIMLDEVLMMSTYLTDSMI